MNNTDTPTPALSLAAVVTPERRRLWVRTVLGCPELSAAQKTVLIALETFADYRDGTNAHPGDANLAEICGLTTRAVQPAIAKARQLGFIERTGEPNSRAGRAAVYRLTLPATTGTAVPVDNSTTGTTVPVETVTTGTAVPVDNSTTGTAVHDDRNGHDTTTGTAVPTTLQAPSKHPGVSPNPGTSPAAHVAAHTPKPSQFCEKHPIGTPKSCPDCGNARTHLKAWTAAQAERDVAIAAAEDFTRRRRRQLINDCPHCDQDGWRNDDYELRCEHPPAATVGYG